MRTLDTNRKKRPVSAGRGAVPEKLTRRRTQAERSVEMRERLSRAAYEVIARRGHSAFRTAAVASHAGVSQGALLHHFANKDAVTLAAIEYALAVAASASRSRLDKTPDVDGMILAQMLADFRAFFKGDGFWVALDITMDASKNAKLAPRIRKLVAAHRRPIYEQWTRKLRDNGWSEARAGDAVRMTAALVSGFAIRSLWSADEDIWPSIDVTWLKFLRDGGTDRGESL
jgi:AcrR family transcriptional regulator